MNATIHTPNEQILPRTFASARRSDVRSARRFTPYRSVVRSRKRTVPVSVKTHSFTEGRRRSDRSSEAAPFEADDIINKTWRLYRVSPLYNLSYKPALLKQYGRALALSIEAESRRGTAIATDAIGSKTVEFSRNASLRTNAGDANSIQIIIKDRVRGDKNDKVLLTAHLCCVELSDIVRQAVVQEFTYLPVMLVKGTVALTHLLVDYLQKRFDCVIREMNLSTTDMHWMLAINAGFVPENLEKKPTELLYRLGKEIHGINKITFTIDSTHCKELMKCLCRSESSDLNKHQKDRFVFALEQHFHNHFKLNLRSLNLERVATAVCVLSSDGKLKIFSAKHVLQVLSFLTMLCSEHLEKVCGILP